jgi:hypothetical protein
VQKYTFSIKDLQKMKFFSQTTPRPTDKPKPQALNSYNSRQKKSVLGKKSLGKV